MEWTDLLTGAVGILGSVFSGGVTGVIGTVVSRVADHFQRKQDLALMKMKNDHELAKMDKQTAMVKAEGDAALAVAQAAAEGRREEADAGAFAESFRMEPKRYSQGMTFPDRWYGRFLQAVASTLMFLLDFFRGVMRPGLTAYLAVITTMMFYTVLDLLDRYGIAIKADKLEMLVFAMVCTFLYLFTTCVTWWFGTRNKQKPPALPAT